MFAHFNLKGSKTASIALGLYIVVEVQGINKVLLE